MSKWDALKCLLGLHSWSRWRAIPPGVGIVATGFNPRPYAQQRRRCEFCGQAQTRPWQGRMRNHSTKEQPK